MTHSRNIWRALISYLLIAISAGFSCTVSAKPFAQIEVLRPFVQLDPVRVNELSNSNQRRAGTRRSSVVVVNGSLIAGGEPPDLVGELLPVRRVIKNAFRMRVDQLIQIPKLRARLKSRSGGLNQFSAQSDHLAVSQLPAVATITALRYEERLGQRWMIGDVELLIDAAAASRMGAFSGHLSFEVASF